MKKVRLCYRIVLGCFLVGIISLAPLMVYLNNQAGDFYVTTAWRTTNFATFGNINHPRDQIIAYASITHVDAQKFSFDARFRFINNHAIDGQRAGFEFATDTATKTFDPDVVLPVMDTKMTIYEGTPIQYPFDVYKGLMILQFTASVDGWVANATLEQRFLNNGILPIYVDFTRSRTTKFYAIFVGTLMWILSLSAFFISVSIWSRGRKVEPPTIAVAGALLFALPQLRNTQPGAPLLGCSADCASFFIAMFLVAISMTMNMCNYIVRYTKEKKLQGATSERTIAMV